MPIDACPSDGRLAGGLTADSVYVVQVRRGVAKRTLAELAEVSAHLRETGIRGSASRATGARIHGEQRTRTWAIGVASVTSCNGQERDCRRGHRLRTSLLDSPASCPIFRRASGRPRGTADKPARSQQDLRVQQALPCTAPARPSPPRRQTQTLALSPSLRTFPCPTSSSAR